MGKSIWRGARRSNTASTTIIAAAMASAHHGEPRLTGVCVPVAAPAGRASAIRASPIAWSRNWGSFCRQRPSSARTCAEAYFGISGSCMITAARTSETVSPAYMARPVSISAAPRRRPRYRHAGRPACLLRLLRRHVGGSADDDTGHGGTHGQRGRRRRIAGPDARSALARPKSSTFTRPSGVTLTLAGFRSRWTMPFSCAYSSASAI